MLTELEKKALSHLDEELLVRWTQELVRFDTVPRPGKTDVETPAARWIEDRCQEMGLETHFEWAAPGRPNVIAILPGTRADKRLMFEGHTDVVTEGNRDAWTYDPFGAEIVDGRIYGRGANDMKSGLAAAMAAIKAIVDSGIRLRGDILLGAIADEEGLMLGIKDFVRRGWADTVSAAIVCEPEDNRLCIAQKGVMWVDVTVKGIMAHGAMPYTGVNPITYLSRFIAGVHELEKEYPQRYGEHEFLGTPSLSPTHIHAPLDEHGTNNVIPEVARAVLDIRMIPGQDVDVTLNDLKAISAQLQEEESRIQFTFDVIDARPPTDTPRDEPVVQALAAATHDVAGREPVYGGVPGTTDGTILYTQAGVPIVTCGPGDIYIPHHVDEYVEIAQLVEAAKIYIVAAMRYLIPNA